MADSLAAALPDWTIVRMPTLWYGVDGADQIPDRHDFRGTVSLRAATLRAIVADLGSQLADQGFRWIFLVHDHGAPLEHIALSDAADFVRQTRKIGMFNVSSIGFFDGDPAVHAAFQKRFSEAERARIGFDIHAGTSETSAMLAAQPELVSPKLRTLPDVTVHDIDEMEMAGRRPEWRGYWSAPALADAELGRRQLDAMADEWTRLALRAIRGEDISKLPRYPEAPPIEAVQRQAAKSLQSQKAAERQFQEWLAKHGSMLDR
jgi:creatinine amidohydrolase